MRFVALMLAAAPHVPGAQTAQDPATLSSIVERVVDSVARVAEQNYVFADTGRMVADYLRKRLRDGSYRSVVELAQLADRLTTDMQAVNGDRHLYVAYAGRSGSPSDAGPVRQAVTRRPAEVSPADVWGQRANYDFNSVQRLAGNVGYLSLFQLSSRGTEEAFAVIDAAMAFLERADAVIIDLRRTAGGEPRMSDYLASYFFGAEPVPTLNSYSRRMNRTIERTTLPVNGKRRPDIPVYVLVGKGTASGTEDFAFIMKQSGRGTLVGGRTAGAGRLTRMYPVGNGFVASVSGGRTYDPRTGKEWERVGIEPDVASSDADALTTAHAAALERIASATSDSLWKNALAWTRIAVLARANPVVLPESALRDYAGDYDVRLVRLENGKLWYQRDATRPREELTPVDARTFALGEATRVEFVSDGSRVTSMKLVTPLGQLSTFPRTR
jgi:hypothetical protein